MSLIVSNPHDDWNAFPNPSIPILPCINRISLFKKRFKLNDDLSIFYRGDTIFTNSGRYSLSMALEFLRVDREEITILMPSFHCLSMIAPVFESKVGIRFYKIKEDLQVDFADIKQKITPDVKVLLAVHYFGFPQDLDQLSGFCKKHKIFLIEDCAHAFFDRSGAMLIGTKGDIAIGSVKKFFPVQEGGSLICNTPGRFSKKQRKTTCVDEIKQLIYLFDEWKYFNKLKMLLRSVLRTEPLRKNGSSKILSHKTKNPIKEIDKLNAWFDPGHHGVQMSRISKFIFNHVNHLDICNKRIQHFSYLLENLSGLDKVYPLYSSLGKGVVPYMFPLVLRNPEKDFKRLKFKKIPMWRWEELCITDCRFSRFYSKHLIQLPCHQGLKKTHLDKMIHAIRSL